MYIKVQHKDCIDESTEQDQSVVSIENGEELLPGTIVACYLSKYEDEKLQLGKVTFTDGDELQVEWTIGIHSEPRLIQKKKGTQI